MRADFRDGTADIARVQPARKNCPSPCRDRSGDLPVDRSSSPASTDRVVRIKQDRDLFRQPVNRGWFESLGHRHRLDQRLTHPLEIRQPFASVQLHRIERHELGDLHHLIDPLINKYPHACDLCGQSRRNRMFVRIAGG